VIKRAWYAPKFIQYDGTNSAEILGYFKYEVGIQSQVEEQPYIYSETGGVLTIRYDQHSANHLPTDSQINEGDWYLIGRGLTAHPYNDRELGPEATPITNAVFTRDYVIVPG
jgi:hypothetical protein